MKALLQKFAPPLKGQKRWPATLALICVVLCATWMSTASGGYYVDDWAPVALVLAFVALFVSIVGFFRGVPPSRLVLLALGLFVAYLGWTLASLLWASNRGDAWVGTGQTLLYVLAFWIAVASILLGASRRWALGASVLGPSVIAALTLLALAGPNFEAFFGENGRLQGSVTYFNGEAAFLLLPFWVAVYLVGSRRINPFIRGAVLAGAVLSAELAVLTQSRGMAVAMALSIPLFFVFSGARLRGLIALAPVALSLLLTFPALNRVYLAGASDGSLEAALQGALSLVWVSALGCGLYGLLWGFVDAKWVPPELLTRVGGGVALVGVVLVLLAGAAVAYERTGGDPAGFVSEKWEAFKTNDAPDAGQSRYLSASSNRFTFWEVAMEDFRAHPLKGVGTHNYEATFYQLRDRAGGHVRQPHSLPLEVLAERGIVGGALFFSFLGVCAGTGLWRRFSRLDPESRAQVGALIAAVGYWFVHASAEWLWQLPAVTLPAIVYLALLVSPWRRGETSSEPRQRVPLRLFGAGLAVFAILIVAPLYIGELYLQKSEEMRDPQKALAAIERAQTFNPLESEFARREGELATTAGQWERAESSYRRAISLNPDHYAPYVFLAAYYEGRGELEKAREYYRKALEHNPLDPRLQRKAAKLEN